MCSQGRALFRTGLFLVIAFNAVSLAKGDHDDNGGGPSQKPIASPSSRGRQGAGGCSVDPESLADFANGEAYDFRGMVSYLSSPACAESGRIIAQVALLKGVHFSSSGPIKLEPFAKGMSYEDLASWKKIDNLVQTEIPNMLRDSPLSSNEMLPIVGQLALLSPDAARYAMVNLIEKELYAADQLLSQDKTDAQRSLTANSIAQTLDRMGVEESAIASELASQVEDMAQLALADSLAKIFRTLGVATLVDPGLVASFNLSAGALNRGVQKAKNIYSEGNQDELLKAVFAGIKAAIGGNESLEPGALELNEALATLLNGKALNITSLQKVWAEALKVLGATTTQAALADAVALSLTPDVVFLSDRARKPLVDAAKNYPVLALSLQAQFLASLQRSEEAVKAGQSTKAHWEQVRRRFFQPLATAMLDLGPDRMDHRWLREIWTHGFVTDEDIEKRFPRFVLAYLDKQNQAMKLALRSPDLEGNFTAMTQSFAVLWTLSSAQIPALSDWAKRFDQTK